MTQRAIYKINAVDTHNIYGNVLEWSWATTIVRLRIKNFPEHLRKYLFSGATFLIDADLSASEPEGLQITVWEYSDGT